MLGCIGSGDNIAADRQEGSLDVSRYFLPPKVQNRTVISVEIVDAALHLSEYGFEVHIVDASSNNREDI